MAQFIGILPLEARTSDVTGKDITVAEKYQAAHVVIDVTAGTDFNLVASINQSFRLLLFSGFFFGFFHLF